VLICKLPAPLPKWVPPAFLEKLRVQAQLWRLRKGSVCTGSAKRKWRYVTSFWRRPAQRVRIALYERKLCGKTNLGRAGRQRRRRASQVNAHPVGFRGSPVASLAFLGGAGEALAKGWARAPIEAGNPKQFVVLRWE
jgi:hypothetical protein